ncbi:glycoside hydrolase family 30 beta sandwich domain-containing protein [Coprobacter sp.]
MAFENPDGKITVIIVNRDNQEKNISLSVKGKYLNLKLKGKSFNTLNL